jgi:hypothetical protein
MKLIIPGAFYETDVALARLSHHVFLPICALKDNGNPALRPDLVERYRQMYEDGHDLGPLSVVKRTVHRDLMIADGYHRAAALEQLGRKTARCRIYRGDRMTVILLAARENGRCEHGGRGLAFGQAEHTETIHMLTFWLKGYDVMWSD